jgi:hypothetical protein
MVFTGRLVGAEAGPAMILLVLLPGVLPALCLLLAALGASWPLALGVLAGLALKAVALAGLRRRLLGLRERPDVVAWEVLADLLQPVHTLGAMLANGRITWRGRPMLLDRSGRVAA